jgi:hypothetical protein
LRHAYATACLRPRTHPAGASAAWRPSPHMAVEPQPHSGALAGAAAGPAGRAVAAPYAAAAALSNASGIGIPSTTGVHAAPARQAVRRHGKDVAGRPRPNDPAAWGYAATSPMAEKIWRTTPPSLADTSAAGSRFNGQTAPANSSPGALNLFLSFQTKPCLGYCITRGIGLRRQATILRLRGAVLFAEAAREWERACGASPYSARTSDVPTRGKCICR